MILMALSGGARTLVEVRENFFAFSRYFGAFAPLYVHARADYDAFLDQLSQDLDKMVDLGLVNHHQERYELTEVGGQQADEHLAGMRQAASLLRKLLQPQSAAKIGVAVHLGLAAVKLPAAFLSGSVGLLNDGIDTLLDGLSSLMVYFGVRYAKEQLVNAILILIMLVTGSLTFYEAIRRFFIPFEPSVDWFTFLSALLSAVVCLGLGLYQRYIGMRSGNMAFITQSIDSRNHVIVAGGVLCGLVAVLLHIWLLDALIGVTVAILILKNGLELVVELIRSRSDEGSNLSRYEIGWLRKYQQFKQDQLRDWLLYLVCTDQAHTRHDLLQQASTALDFEQYPALNAFVGGYQSYTPEIIEHSLAELIERGWLAGDETLQVTPAGQAHAHSQMQRANQIMGHSLFEEKHGRYRE